LQHNHRPDSLGKNARFGASSDGGEKMKRHAIALMLMLFIAASSVLAQSRAEKKAAEQLEDAFSKAYLAEDLGRLDAKRPYRGSVRIVIEHSLLEGKDQYEVRQFKTLASIERWLRSRTREDGTPFRDWRPLIQCARGLCTYDFDGGILHNHLYLKRIRYGYRNGRAYLKTIYLLDGD
jgi:hypothetical protein